MKGFFGAFLFLVSYSFIAGLVFGQSTQHLFDSSWPPDFVIKNTTDSNSGSATLSVWEQRNLAGRWVAIEKRIRDVRLSLRGDTNCEVFFKELDRLEEKAQSLSRRVLFDAVELNKENNRALEFEKLFSDFEALVLSKCRISLFSETDKLRDPDREFRISIDVQSKGAMGTGQSKSLSKGLDSDVKLNLGHFKSLGSVYYDINANPQIGYVFGEMGWGGESRTRVEFGDPGSSQKLSLTALGTRNYGKWRLDQLGIQRLHSLGVGADYRFKVLNRGFNFKTDFIHRDSGEDLYLKGNQFGIELSVPVSESLLSNRHSVDFEYLRFRGFNSYVYPSTQRVSMSYTQKGPLSFGGEGYFKMGLMEQRDSSLKVNLVPRFKFGLKEAPLGAFGPKFPSIVGQVYFESIGFSDYSFSQGRLDEISAEVSGDFSGKFKLGLDGAIRRKSNLSNVLLPNGIKQTDFVLGLIFVWNLKPQGSLFSFSTQFVESFFSGAFTQQLDDRVWAFPLGQRRQFFLGVNWKHEIK